MKKFVKLLPSVMLIIATVFILTACRPSTPEKAYEKLKADIGKVGYTVTELTAEQTDGFPYAVTSGFRAVKEGETFVLILFNESLEGKPNAYTELSGGFALLDANGGFSGSHGRFAYRSSKNDESEAGKIFSKTVNKNNSGQ